MPAPFVLSDGRALGFERTVVMGVLNTTPDSFSDGGHYADAEAAIARGLALARGGARIIDVGGESTRPGSDPVPAHEQLRRVLPVVRALAEAGLVVSVDTTSAEVAAAALAAGAEIINDISAFRFDPEMLPLLASCRAPAIAMHTLGPPKTMQMAPRYDDVVREVTEHLAERVRVAEAAGVDPARLALDPGIGFGKRLEDNLALLRHLDRVVALGRPVLVGTSRKAFIGHLTGKPVGERLMGTAASVAIAIAHGAHIVRVHEPAELADVVAVADAITHAPLRPPAGP